MARARMIDPYGLLDDEVISLSIGARLLWSYLPCYADRDGRLSGTPFGAAMLKGSVFPRDDISVPGLIDELVHAGLVTRYEACGRACLQIKDFVAKHSPGARETALCPAYGESAEAFEERRWLGKSAANDPWNRERPGAPERRRKQTLDRGRSWDSIRRKALERDGFSCRRCAATGRLDVHHKVPLRKFNGDLERANALDNLISLCRSCHNRADAEVRRLEMS